ncbi:MAG TPA: molecular chaperone DnaK, partial [Candidatus Paceibacterota bacterium]|nr:molecular chaperone DnaK [Candidatus Paceibacterota bacterium]
LVEDNMAALRTAKDGTDMEAIKSATTALSDSLTKIGEEMAKAGQSAGADAGAAGEGAPEGTQQTESTSEPKADGAEGEQK